jgi:ABC-type Fe3+/spermidine/putrescine transport system ATPase subunit
MTVFENVAYPLKLRRLPRDEMRRKVLETLRLVGLEQVADRQAPQLSGGQQQRVALARALVFSPEVLLLDEPLSNLDALLRDEMRRQLKDLQRRVGVTTVFVTHDQVEALSLSDRIAIMNAGRVEQVGSPQEVYTSPATPFAQSFLGKILTVDGRVTRLEGGEAKVLLTGMEQAPLSLPAHGDGNIPGRARETGPLKAGSEVVVAVRPEQILVSIAPPANGSNVVPARIHSTLFIGDRCEYVVELGTVTRVITLPSNQRFATGDRVYLEFPREAMSLWPK